jgi:hypothetical protein
MELTKETKAMGKAMELKVLMQALMRFVLARQQTGARTRSLHSVAPPPQAVRAAVVHPPVQVAVELRPAVEAVARRVEEAVEGLHVGEVVAVLARRRRR